jgi:hypothetical protein
MLKTLSKENIFEITNVNVMLVSVSCLRNLARESQEKEEKPRHGWNPQTNRRRPKSGSANSALKAAAAASSPFLHRPKCIRS